MLQSELIWYGETDDQFSEDRVASNLSGKDPICSARRRIERLRELQQLRDLLDDPGFDDSDWTAGYSPILQTADEKSMENGK